MSLPAKLDKKLERLDRIFYSYDSDEAHRALSDSDKEYKVQLEAAWGLLLKYHSYEKSWPKLKSRFGISRATAYRVLNNATKVFGDIMEMDAKGIENIHYELAAKNYRLALKQKDVKAMNGALRLMNAIKGNKKEDGGITAEMLEAHTYMMQLNGTAAGEVKTIDISHLQKLPEAEYAEVVEAVENLALGQQSIEDILDNKVFNQKEDDES